VNKRELFLNNDLRCGGFYELCIQVSSSIELEPIHSYTKYIWNLPNVEGPYDKNFDKVQLEEEPWMEYQGILNVNKYSIPFQTFNISENEPIETGFNWFDISFHTEAIEAVFGHGYNTWKGIPKPPELLKSFIHDTASNLYKLHPFKLGLLGFEVSCQYYLDDLKTDLQNMGYTEFLVGRENLHLISSGNRKEVIII
jgi:hypothetical protein